MSHQDWGARVAIRRGGDPVALAMGALGEALDPAELKNKIVLVKPNCCYPAPPGSGMVAHAETARGVVRFCQQAGAREVWLGDGAIFGLDTDQALEKTGMARVAREEDCRLVNLDACEPVVVEPKEPMAVEKMKVSSLALKADAIITLPVMKSHMHAVASLGLKNMKGCLHGKQKRDFHHLGEKPRFAAWQDYKPIDRAIADLFAVLPPFATVVDAVVAMEGLGPLLGEPKPLDLVLASRDPLAADLAGLAIMDIAPEKVCHLGLAARHAGRELPSWRELNLDLAAFAAAIAPFKPAAAPDIAKRFPEFEVREAEVCSACPATVSAFLLTHGQKYAGHAKIQVALGRDLDPAELAPGVILLGNCTAKHKARGHFIQGCPPVPSDIVKAIAELDRGRG